MISVKINYSPSIINHFAVLYLPLSLSFCFFQLSFFLFGFFSYFKAPSPSCHRHTIHFPSSRAEYKLAALGLSEVKSMLRRAARGLV